MVRVFSTSGVGNHQYGRMRCQPSSTAWDNPTAILPAFLLRKMKSSKSTGTDGYDPGRLLSALRAQRKLRSDVGLARALEVPAELLSRVRTGEIPVMPELLIRMEEVSGWSGRELRDLMGDRRAKFRFDQVRNSGFEELISEIYAMADAKKSC